MNRTSEEIASTYQFDVTCAGSVPEAIICALEVADLKDKAGAPYPITPRDYVKAIRNAVSLGGDCDTLTCIAGGMAESFYDVPDEFKAECEKRLPEEFLQILKNFRKFIGK